MIEQNNYKTIRCILLSKREGDYSVYAFENVDEVGEKYVMCTRLPNWDVPDINIYQEGILTYHPVRSGIDKWYDPITGLFNIYRHSANYFIDFVPITHVVAGNTITEKQKLIVT